MALSSIASLSCAQVNQGVRSTSLPVPSVWISPEGRDHPLAGRIFDVNAQSFVTESDLFTRTASSRFVLLGEVHDNADHHRLEARILQEIVARGRRPRVVFEMINVDQQPTVDRHRAADRSNPDALASRLDWDTSGWPSWALYRPIFAAALEADLEIVGANISRSEAMAISTQKKSIDPGLRQRHALDVPLPEPLHAGLVEDLIEGHCHMMPSSMIDPMVTIQRLRDAMMADAMSAAGQDGAVLIAGAGHTRTDRGAPFYLGADVRPLALSLGFVEVDDDRVAPSEYGDGPGTRALPFDLVWFTARRAEHDPCRSLRERFRSRDRGQDRRQDQG